MGLNVMAVRTPSDPTRNFTAGLPFRVLTVLALNALGFMDCGLRVSTMLALYSTVPFSFSTVCWQSRDTIFFSSKSIL